MSTSPPETIAWPKVTATDEETLVRLVVPYVRWLDPRLVAEVKQDNLTQLAVWEELLTHWAIPADLYVWPGSACAFPGIRRRAGKGNEQAQHCLRFDHNGNRLAHRVWELLGSSGTQFKVDRANYELVHLFPHQPTEWEKLFTTNEKSASRLRRILPVDWQKQLGQWTERLTQNGLPALFSNPANMCFLPGTLVRPTDNDSLLRLVLWRKAILLYGADTLFPPDLASPLAAWLKAMPEPAGLNWSQCYHGSEARLQALLVVRQQHLKEFLVSNPHLDLLLP